MLQDLLNSIRIVFNLSRILLVSIWPLYVLIIIVTPLFVWWSKNWGHLKDGYERDYVANKINKYIELVYHGIPRYTLHKSSNKNERR